MPIRGLKYFGVLSIDTSTPISQQTYLTTRPTAITLTKEQETNDVLGYVNGITSGEIQTTDTIKAAASYTAEMTISSLDWIGMQLLFGEFASVTTSYTRALTGSGTVPSSGTYEIVDTALASVAGGSITGVTISKRGAWGEMLYLSVSTATTTPTTSQVQYTSTTSAGTFTFAAGLAGAPVDYSYTKAASNIPTIGVESTAKLIESVSFVGEMVFAGGRTANGVGIYIPKMDLSGAYELPVANGGDVPEITISFTPVLVSGRQSPIEAYYLPA